MITNLKLEKFLTGGTPSNDILMERNSVCCAAPQPHTAATGGDGVAVLEYPAYSLPTDIQTTPSSYSLTAATDRDGQQKNDGGYDRLGRSITLL